MIYESDLPELCRRLRQYPGTEGERLFAKFFKADVAKGRPCYRKMLGLARNCNGHDGPCRPVGFGGDRMYSTTLMRGGRFLFYLAQIPNSHSGILDLLVSQAEDLGFEVDLDQVSDVRISSFISSEHTCVSVYNLEDLLGKWR